MAVLGRTTASLLTETCLTLWTAVGWMKHTKRYVSNNRLFMRIQITIQRLNISPVKLSTGGTHKVCPLTGRQMVRVTSSLEYSSLRSRPFSEISEREASDLVMFLVVGSRRGPRYSADTAFICTESRGSTCEQVINIKHEATPPPDGYSVNTQKWGRALYKNEGKRMSFTFLLKSSWLADNFIWGKLWKNKCNV